MTLRLQLIIALVHPRHSLGRDRRRTATCSNPFLIQSPTSCSLMASCSTTNEFLSEAPLPGRPNKRKAINAILTCSIEMFGTHSEKFKSMKANLDIAMCICGFFIPSDATFKWVSIFNARKCIRSNCNLRKFLDSYTSKNTLLEKFWNIFLTCFLKKINK